MNDAEQSSYVQHDSQSMDSPLIQRGISSETTTPKGTSPTISEERRPLTAPKFVEQRPALLPAADVQPKTSDSRQKLLSGQSPQIHYDDIPRAESGKGKQPLLPKKSPRSKQEKRERGRSQTKRTDKQCCGCCRANSPKRGSENDAKHIQAINEQHAPRCNHSSWCCACCGGPHDTESPDSEGEKCGPRCSRCCKQFMAFLFSHVGLCSMVVAYSIMGGFLFSYLEASEELQERVEVSRRRHHSVSKLWNMTQELNVLYEKNWTALADRILREFQDDVMSAVRDGWDGRDESNEDVKWSFSGSLLYSITVITTIGYGHIAPKTDYGRLATMFYALIGIPLTLLCLSNIGSSCANCFRFLYKHFCHFMLYLFCPARHKKKKKNNLLKSTPSPTPAVNKKSKSSERSKKTAADVVSAEQGSSSQEAKDGTSGPPENSESETVRVPIFVSLIIIASYVFGGAVLFSLWEQDWNYLIGAYFCFITLSTIGFGDYVFGVGKDLDSNEKLITCALYLVMGLSIIAMCFNLMQEEVMAKFRYLGRKLGIIDKSKGCRRRK